MPSQARSDARAAGAAVAAHQHGAQPGRVQCCAARSSSRAVAQPVAEREQADEARRRALHVRQPRHGAPFGLQRGRGARRAAEGRRRVRPSSAQLPRRSSTAWSASATRAATPLPATARARRSRAARDACLPCAPRPRPRARADARCSTCSAAASESSASASPSTASQATSAGLPSVSVPVFVECDRAHGMRDLQRLGVLDDIDAAPRRGAGAGHDRRGRRQPERAGAGAITSTETAFSTASLPAVAAQPPGEQRGERDRADHRHEHRAHAIDEVLDRRLLPPARSSTSRTDARERRFRADRASPRPAARPRR